MIYNIYKPKGWTSYDVVRKIKRETGEKKVGHAGTLDPLAEGVLIVLTGGDTKRQRDFMLLKKEYMAEIGFGASSSTYDLGSDLNFSETRPSLSDLKASFSTLLPKYTGTIQQRVPPFSAVKVDGVRLYKRARKGTISEDTLPVKTVEIYSIEPLAFFNTSVGSVDLPTLKCLITCSSGTYIRSLAHDMGAELGCGGVLLSLVRTKIGDYRLEDARKLESSVD